MFDLWLSLKTRKCCRTSETYHQHIISASRQRQQCCLVFQPSSRSLVVCLADWLCPTPMTLSSCSATAFRFQNWRSLYSLRIAPCNTGLFLSEYDDVIRSTLQDIMNVDLDMTRGTSWLCQWSMVVSAFDGRPTLRFRLSRRRSTTRMHQLIADLLPHHLHASLGTNDLIRSWLQLAGDRPTRPSPSSMKSSFLEAQKACCMGHRARDRSGGESVVSCTSTGGQSSSILRLRHRTPGRSRASVFVRHSALDSTTRRCVSRMPPTSPPPRLRAPRSV